MGAPSPRWSQGRELWGFSRAGPTRLLRTRQFLQDGHAARSAPTSNVNSLRSRDRAEEGQEENIACETREWDPSRDPLTLNEEGCSFLGNLVCRAEAPWKGGPSLRSLALACGALRHVSAVQHWAPGVAALQASLAPRPGPGWPEVRSARGVHRCQNLLARLRFHTAASLSRSPRSPHAGPAQYCQAVHLECPHAASCSATTMSCRGRLGQPH